MTNKQKEQFNRMRKTLQRISKEYLTPTQISKEASEFCNYTDYLEMSYENIQQEAKAACKNVREIK